MTLLFNNRLSINRKPSKRLLIKLSFVITALIISATAYSQMILEYNTNLSAGTTIGIPLGSDGNVTVDWGDEQDDDIYTTSGLKLHTYSSEGTYTVTITGTLSAYGISDPTVEYVDKLQRVISFGDLGITSFRHAFSNAYNLTDVPNLLPAGVTDLSRMFRNDTLFNGDISNWDVSEVRDMSFMFRNAHVFNGDIGSWNVSNVYTLSGMFSFAYSFNQDISNWNVSRVINMYGVFLNDSTFNQDISSWDVSNVIDMNAMFAATSFNQDISRWDVSKVTNMAYMFNYASDFNQDLSDWDVGEVNNMSNMFAYAYNFDQDLSNWDVSSVTNMTNMFKDATLSTPNYDALLKQWSTLSLINGLSFHAGLSKHSCLSITERQSIIDNYSWTITDNSTATLGALVTIDSNITCPGDNDGQLSVSVSCGTGDYSYLWSTGATAPTISSLAPGTYTVKVTDINTSDTIIASARISELVATTNNVMHVSGSGNEDGSVSIRVVGGVLPYVYSWTGPDGFSVDTEDIDTVSGGEYNLTIRDNNGTGCPVYLTEIVKEPISVSTNAISSIGLDTAIGNGSINNLGFPTPTSHGVCWSTSANPSVALSTKTDEGAASTTGAFTSSIIDLNASTQYYVRAYASNSEGTVYGTERSFTTADPVVKFTTTESEAEESVSTANITIETSAISTLDVSVNYTITGTAEGVGTDYTLSNGIATIDAGTTSTTITISDIVDDALFENDETIIITLSAPINADLGSNTIYTYTILNNDDAPTIEFSSESSEGLESVANASIAVELSALSGIDCNVNYTVSGTADGGAVDYTLDNGSVTILANSISNTITISDIVNDEIFETNETVIVTLSAPSNAILGTKLTHTYTINNDDTAPTVSFSSATSNGDESVNSANIDVKLSTVSSFTTTVDYTISGTASGNGVDYNLNDGTLTIEAGATSGSIAITDIVNDDEIEDDETIVITLSNPNNASLNADSVHTYTIINDDAANTSPIAVNDTITTDKNTAKQIDVLSNDSGLEDGGITLSITTPSANGSSTINADNTITFTPNNEYSGKTSFIYEVCDTDGDCASATVVITVTPSSAINTNAIELSMYPNPVSNELHLNNYKTQPTEYTIVNQSGKIVLNGICENGIIQMSELKAGIYFIIIDNNTAKIIKN